LSTTISLINIHSIILELPDNNNQSITDIQKVLTAQISRQKRENFFRTLTGFKFQNFDMMEWIKGNEKGKFEIDEIRNPRIVWGKEFEFWDLKKGRSSQKFVKEIEEIIARNDEKYILKNGWNISLYNALLYPPAGLEDYHRETCRVFRQIEKEIKDKKDRGVDKLYYQRLPTSYEIAQRIEDTVWGPGKITVKLLTEEQIEELHWNYYRMKEWLEQDIAMYTGWDRVK
jgi:hypothetical protein